MISAFDNPFYYLANFQLVLDWIAARYADLLTPEEQAFIAQFGLLPQPSRALFVRMVMRKGELFRASKLNYAEIGDTVVAARALLALGWIQSDPLLDLDQLFDVLLKNEINAVFKLAAAEKALRKADQLELLRERQPDVQHFSKWMAAASGSAEDVYQMLAKPLCERLRLLFFGNLRQDWSEFVLADLGIYQYEKVEFSLSSRAFRVRRDVDDYLALQACRERFINEEPLTEVLAQLADTASDNEWLAGRREKLLFQIAQHLEKTRDWEAALKVYSTCRYPGARIRTIRVLEKDGQAALAMEWLQVAQQAPESDAERQQLLRIAPRLQRQLGLTKTSATAAAPVQRIDLCLPFPATPCTVEGVVRDHLHQTHAPVFYVENTLINSLFGLLCWEAIFKSVPGAFFHPFHRGPADLHSVDFQQKRATELQECLALADNGCLQNPHPANLHAEVWHSVALCGLECDRCRTAGVGAGLYSGAAFATLVRAHLARYSSQPEWFP